MWKGKEEREIICVLFFRLQIPIYFEFLDPTRYKFNVIISFRFMMHPQTTALDSISVQREADRVSAAHKGLIH